MKYIIFLSIFFCAIAIPTFAELTDADLDKIRLILRKEIQDEITASEKRMKEYIDLKIENIDIELKRLDAHNKNIESQFGFMRILFISVVGAPLALLVVLFAWRAFRDSVINKQIDGLIREHQNDSKRISEQFENALINERMRDEIYRERMEAQISRLERETSQPSQDK